MTKMVALYSRRQSANAECLRRLDEGDDFDIESDFDEVESLESDFDDDDIEWVDTASDEFYNLALRRGEVWTGSESVSADPDDPAEITFIPVSDSTAGVRDPDWLAQHPDVHLVDASPGDAWPDLVERFAAVGADIGEFAPESSRSSNVPGLTDLTLARSLPERPRNWLESGIIEQGAVNKLTAASGSGKTVLTAHMAVNWSLGLSALDVGVDGKARRLDRPLRVLYVDGELGVSWWTDYMRRFGFPRHLPNLLLRTLSSTDDDAPEWPALSTPDGAATFLEFVRSVEHESGRLDVIVLDTLSAFVGGEESGNDTWLEFDRYVTLALKARGCTVVYVDHTGHDTTRARGASAKKAKLDVEWVLDLPEKSDPNRLRLSNLPGTGKMRHGFDGHPNVVHLERRDDPLRHDRIDAPAKRGSAGESSALDDEDKVLALVVALDKAKVPIKTTQRPAIQALREAGHKFDDRHLRRAIQARKDRESARLAAAESVSEKSAAEVSE
ncbi:hypothetical protein BXO91_23205 [Rhodococcus qingshengii]|nr:hypothetical protein BXO91_23205 [Rhodococcus qingshengii]